MYDISDMGYSRELRELEMNQKQPVEIVNELIGCVVEFIPDYKDTNKNGRDIIIFPKGTIYIGRPAPDVGKIIMTVQITDKFRKGMIPIFNNFLDPKFNQIEEEEELNVTDYSDQILELEDEESYEELLDLINAHNIITFNPNRENLTIEFEDKKDFLKVLKSIELMSDEDLICVGKTTNEKYFEYVRNKIPVYTDNLNLYIPKIYKK